MKVPSYEEFNSYACHVVDAMGGVYLSTTATNRPGAAEASKKHADWWIARQKRPGAYKDWSRQPWRQPCGELKFVIEFYNDKTAR